MILPLFIFFIVLFLFLKFVFKEIDESEKSYQQIPGPKGFPLIGNIEDLFCGEEERWSRIRDRALKFFPIYKMNVLSQKMVHLVDPKDVEVILSNPKYLSKGRFYGPFRDWLGDGILISGGEIWRKSRKLLTKSFHFGALTNYMNTFYKNVAHLNSSLEAENGKPTEHSSYVKFHTLRIICAAMCGEQLEISQKSAKLLLEALDTLSKITIDRMTVPLMNYLYKFTYLRKLETDALKDFNNFTSHLIENKSYLESMEEMDQPRLLKILLQNYDDQGLKYQINTFLFAGQDTTITSLTFMLYVLANKPYFQDEILKEITTNEKPTYGEIQEMNLLDRFVKECLRMYPPAHLIGRTLNEDVRVPSGYTIPGGTFVLIDIFDIHRNPNNHPQPENFDPDRFLPDNMQGRHPYSFIPFSAGPRNCIAQKFAILEIKITIYVEF